MGRTEHSSRNFRCGKYKQILTSIHSFLVGSWVWPMWPSIIGRYVTLSRICSILLFSSISWMWCQWKRLRGLSKPGGRIVHRHNHQQHDRLDTAWPVKVKPLTIASPSQIWRLIWNRRFKHVNLTNTRKSSCYMLYCGFLLNNANEIFLVCVLISRTVMCVKTKGYCRGKTILRQAGRKTLVEWKM